MSGRVIDHGHRVRQARWYRGGDIVLVQQQAKRDESNTVMIYPEDGSTSAEHTQRPGVLSNPNFPRLEEQVLTYWKTDRYQTMDGRTATVGTNQKITLTVQRI
jgi:hypothetical protein